MIESAGKKLQQARLQKQISIEQAARATKIRPERIADLERDHYATFPNMAYARSFLQTYSKYLDVDVGEFAKNLGNPNPIGVDDYEYLSSGPEKVSRPEPQKRKRSAAPLLALVTVLILACIALYLVVSFMRLGTKLTETPGATTVETATIEPVESQPRNGGNEIVAVPQVTPTQETSVEQSGVPRAMPVEPENAEEAPAEPINEVVLQPIRKTWVKVQTNPDAEPIFEDWLYPDARPLKLRGRRFWIEINDAEAVEVIKNGSTVAYKSPGIQIE